VEAHIKTRLDPVYTLAFLQVSCTRPLAPRCRNVAHARPQSDNDRVDTMFNIRTQHDVKASIPPLPSPLQVTRSLCSDSPGPP
jgi:hypothetical protein